MEETLERRPDMSTPDTTHVLIACEGKCSPAGKSVAAKHTYKSIGPGPGGVPKRAVFYTCDTCGTQRVYGCR